MRQAHVSWVAVMIGLATLAPVQAQEQAPVPPPPPPPAAQPAPPPAQPQEVDPFDQAQGNAGPVVFNLGATLGVPLGSGSDRLNLGGGFTAGITYNAAPAFGVQLEYGANWSSLKTSSPAAALGVFGNATMHYFDLNAVVRPTHTGRFGVYLIGGGGLYYRGVSVNQVNGTAIAPYCDPYLFYCSAVPVSTASVIGSRSEWNGGLDAGLGFTLAVAHATRLYLEARYHYIFGPSFTDSNGQSHSANGQYLPITFGVQF